MPKKVRLEKKLTPTIVESEINGVRYLSTTDEEGNMDLEFLSWYVTSAVATSSNIFWMCSGMPYYMGGSDFVQVMNEKYKDYFQPQVDKP
jgi:hypothetical protein